MFAVPGFAPTLLGGGEVGQDIFIVVGVLVLGISYGQAAGAVTANVYGGGAARQPAPVAAA